MIIPVLYRYKILIFFFICTAFMGFVLAKNNFTGFFSSELFVAHTGIVPSGVLLYICAPLIMISFSFIFLFRVYSESQDTFKKNPQRSHIFYMLIALSFALLVAFSMGVAGFFNAFSQVGENRKRIESLVSSIDIGSVYYEEKLALLQRLSEIRMTALTIQTYKSRPEDLWTLFLREDSGALCFQVRALSGHTAIEVGNSAYFLSHIPDTVYNGFILPRDVVEEPDIIRIASPVRIGDEAYTCVYTSSFSAGYDINMEALRLEYENAVKQGILRENITKAGFPLFFMCLIPAFSVYIALLYRFSVDISNRSALVLCCLKDDGRTDGEAISLSCLLHDEIEKFHEKSAVKIISVEPSDYISRPLLLVHNEVQTTLIVVLLLTFLAKASAVDDEIHIRLHVVDKKCAQGMMRMYRLCARIESTKWYAETELIENYCAKIERLLKKNGGDIFYYEKKAAGGQFFLDFPARTV